MTIPDALGVDIQGDSLAVDQPTGTSLAAGLRRLSITPWAIWCVAIIPHMVAICVTFASIAKGHPPGNLIDFLGAARSMLKGRDIYTGGTGGYVYPPLIAFLYQPLAMLPLRTAAYVSLWISAVLSIFTLFLVSRVLVYRLIGRIDPLLAARVALFGACCTADKIKGEFGHLETNVFMLLCFTLAMRWVDRRPWLCGLALGFAFNIKYLPVVLVPYLLLRWRWRAVVWFAVWAMVFAILPALSMGWSANARAWAEASAGIFRLLGITRNSYCIVHVRRVTDLVSISVTSGLARMTGLKSLWPLSMAACIGAIFCVYAIIIYRRDRIPILAWPSIDAQARAPFRGLLSIEWMGLLLLTLIFSPFTNSRHLYMLLDVNIAAGVLILGTRGLVSRTPLIIGAIIMTLGITFPPGSTVRFDHADRFWRGIGGPGWSMLAMYTTLIWTNARYQRIALGSSRSPI